MTSDYWEERCKGAEERLRRMCDKFTNPPISILNIDYKEQAERHYTKLKKFRRLIDRLYWRRK